MLTDTEFFHAVQLEAQEYGMDGPQVHKSLLPAYQDLTSFVDALGASLRPADFGVCIGCEEPYIYADWADPHSGHVLTIKFTEDARLLEVVDAQDADFCVFQRQFTEALARNMVFLFLPMPSRFTQ